MFLALCWEHFDFERGKMKLSLAPPPLRSLTNPFSRGYRSTCHCIAGAKAVPGRFESTVAPSVAVTRGLDPRLHLLRVDSCEADGWPSATSAGPVSYQGDAATIRVTRCAGNAGTIEACIGGFALPLRSSPGLPPATASLRSWSNDADMSIVSVALLRCAGPFDPM
jgi:hypothetical protein